VFFHAFSLAGLAGGRLPARLSYQIICGFELSWLSEALLRMLGSIYARLMCHEEGKGEPNDIGLAAHEQKSTIS
jgi:hypothetical protein